MQVQKEGGKVNRHEVLAEDSIVVVKLKLELAVHQQRATALADDLENAKNAMWLLRYALQECLVPLAALKESMTWELAPGNKVEMEQAIELAVNVLRKVSL